MTFIGLSFLWESTHPAFMRKNACNGGNGENWRFKLDTKSGLLEIAILAKMAKILDISRIRAINHIEVYR